MRILQLCPKVPWPPDDGGRVAMRVLALSLLRARGGGADALAEPRQAPRRPVARSPTRRAPFASRRSTSTRRSRSAAP